MSSFVVFLFAFRQVAAVALRIHNFPSRDYRVPPSSNKNLEQPPWDAEAFCAVIIRQTARSEQAVSYQLLVISSQETAYWDSLHLTEYLEQIAIPLRRVGRGCPEWQPAFACWAGREGTHKGMPLRRPLLHQSRCKPL
jgi:hypothetical protein